MRNNLILIFLQLIVFTACQKESDSPTSNNSSNNSLSANINGIAQKGPFVVGTPISFWELDNQLNQTGRVFNSQIDNNTGAFQLNATSLGSNYALIQAQGFYFNEICGQNSTAQISLNGIIDYSIQSNIYINLLTHLERQRVEFLVSLDTSFASAKLQAQKEIMDIFEIDLTTSQNSEQLDISQSGDANAALLAITSIIQGFRTESELTSLLNMIGNDIKTDGILNDPTLQAQLIDHALLLDTITIRNNLTSFYSSIGVNTTIPNFEKYISQFINNTSFQAVQNVFSYPTAGNTYENILNKNKTQFSGKGSNYEMIGQGKNCSTLKLKFSVLSGQIYGILVSSKQNISHTVFDFNNNTQWFTIPDPSQPFGAILNFGSGGTYQIDFYEKESQTPTYTHTITITP